MTEHLQNVERGETEGNRCTVGKQKELNRICMDMIIVVTPDGWGQASEVMR